MAPDIFPLHWTQSVSAWINRSVTHSEKSGKNTLLWLNRYVSVNSVTTPTKMVANFPHVKGANSFPQAPSALLVTLNYGLIHNIASKKLIQNMISKLQQHMHIQKQNKRKEGGKEERN